MLQRQQCYNQYISLMNSTDQIVAIKIIQLNSLKSKKLQQLLFQQIQILKKLNHPSVLKCFEIFTSNRNCYIITELCNQGNLQNHLKLRKVFQEAEANPIIKDVYDGLLYLAENNIVHRDLKSANIFLHNGRAKIADFGFAKEISHNFKDLNIGSPLYMAPEGILYNMYGPKTQVWALGILVYELFHGSSPYIYCKTQEELKRSVTIPLNWNQLRRDLSQDIKQFILTCLEINEEKRATIEQLSSLGYIRRLNQLYGNFSINNNFQPEGKFDLRSPSKSVHLANRYDNNEKNGIVELGRVNNNFRTQNNNISREGSVNRNNQRQIVFRSVDMRNHRNQQFQSPKRPQLIGQVNRYNINSPNMKESTSIRPTSAINSGFVNNYQQTYNNYPQQQQQTINPSQQQMINFPQQQMLNPTIQSYQFQPPQQSNFLLRPQQYSNQPDGIVEQQQQFQSVHRPATSYQPMDILGYNSLNGFFPQSQRHQAVTQSYTPQQVSLPQEQKTNQLFRKSISFKQAIFFIHHCRLMFKFLFLYRQEAYFDQSLYLRMFGFLMGILTELGALAEGNGVTAEGEKATVKVKKFRQVNQQYLVKYRRQLQQRNYQIQPQTITQASFQSIIILTRQLYTKLNDEISLLTRKPSLSLSDDNLIVLGHLVMVIISSLKQIQGCISTESFRKMLAFKHIETVLNTPKEEFTLSSYKSYKDKLMSVKK